MTKKNEKSIDDAYDQWITGGPLEAGRLIFENLPIDDRPKWACRILKYVLDRAMITNPMFKPILTAASDQSLWDSGHKVFSKLRAKTLKLDKLRRRAGLSEDQEQLAAILAIAELVAKVTYNSTNPPDEFDEDSGWWIAPILKGLADHGRRHEQCLQEAWSMLSSHR